MANAQARENGLTGQIALVAGASRGIGRAIALRLARDGADVALAARGTAALAEVAEEVRAMGRQALAIEADMSKAGDIEAMVAQTVEAFDHVDILVYNAGVLRIEEVADATDEVWEKTLSINLLGAVRTVREVLGRGKMRQRKSGRIIGISSESGKIGEYGLGAYAASKHGMLGMLRCLGLELGPEGITVNAVCPGLVRSEMSDYVVRGLGKFYGVGPDGLEEWSKDFDPQKRIALPEDVADIVAFLASDAARAMTGQALNMATKIV